MPNGEGGDEDSSDDSDSAPAAVRSAEDLADSSDDDDVFAPREGGTHASFSSSSRSSLSRPSSTCAPGKATSEKNDMCHDADIEPVPAAGGNKRKRLVQADSDGE